MGKKTTFRVRTSIPKGRNTWTTDTTAKVQETLFATVAMLVAENPEAEQMLMDAITNAKAGKTAFSAAM